MAEKIIFHVDVNSAFLSWTAAHRLLVLGEEEDLRTVPSVVAPLDDVRRGIVLAKSPVAKKFGIQTGEPVGMAMQKCPNLRVVAPDYGLYVTASRAFIALLQEYSPVVEQYSIDEAWVDMTGSTSLFGSPILAAEQMKDRIYRELGFTVNIGISSNKLLAKVAGDFEKPNKVHTLFPHEIEEKMWPLPVRDMFSVGPATERKLHDIGVYTIGQLAHTNVDLLRRRLHKPGEILWHFAHGRCNEDFLSPPAENKGYGNSATTPWDVKDLGEARQVLLSLCETVTTRMRKDCQRGALIAVNIRDTDFHDTSKQMTLPSATNVTSEVYDYACRVLDLLWDRKTPLRQLGVSMGKLSHDVYRQCCLFDTQDYARMEKLDATVDKIREKYGEEAICRARFLNGGVAESMAGGLSKHRRTGVTKAVPEEDMFPKKE
ncbi:MAG: DNA polymerase IV [Oscillospiraceae bacterium]|nr:DNA polymerase IV [Oscillospiraceae bacterium]